MPSKIVEVSFADELRQHVEESCQQAAQLLSIDREQDSPRHIAAAIDHWLRQVCGQSSAKRRRPKLDVEETSLLLGCLWGEQLVRAFDWEWIRWSLSEDDDETNAATDEHLSSQEQAHEHSDEGLQEADEDEEEDEQQADDEHDEVLIAVASTDRRLVIYPFHELFLCLDEGAPVKVLLAFDVLSTPGRIPELPAGGYENVMENVHHPS